MRVTVKMFGNLRRHATQSQTELELIVERESTVSDVLRKLGIDYGEIGLVVVNGQVAEDSAVLADGDRLELFAVMAGGGRT